MANAPKPTPPAPPTTANTTPAPAPVNSKFAVLPLPSRGPGIPTEMRKNLTDCPVGQSFIETVTVPADITDATARVAAFDAECKVVANRISGAIRRFRENPAHKNRKYTQRKVADETYGYGIRVWRLDDATA